MPNDQWSTPKWITDLARKTMGTISLDPATNTLAQQYIIADRYFTKETNSLTQAWKGNVWLNPPYSRGYIDKFIEKLLYEWNMHNISQAIVLVNNCTETKWGQDLLSCASATCLLRKRVKFLLDGKQLGSPPCGQMACYFGSDIGTRRFIRLWGEYGLVVRSAT